MTNECPENSQTLRNNLAMPNASMPVKVRCEVRISVVAQRRQLKLHNISNSKMQQTRLADFFPKKMS